MKGDWPPGKEGARAFASLVIFVVSLIILRNEHSDRYLVGGEIVDTPKPKMMTLTLTGQCLCQLLVSYPLRCWIGRNLGGAGKPCLRRVQYAHNEAGTLDICLCCLWAEKDHTPDVHWDERGLGRGTACGEWPGNRSSCSCSRPSVQAGMHTDELCIILLIHFLLCVDHKPVPNQPLAP